MVSESNTGTRLTVRSLFGAGLCAWLLSAAVAVAQPTAAERETARGLMQEGDRLRAAGELRTALERYLAAHAIMHVPTTGLDVARTQAQLGMLVEARGIAVEISNAAPAPNEPRVFIDARAAAVELAADLDARIPSIRTQVTPAEAPVSLTIDGVTLPPEARDIAFRTDPGPHTLVVEAPGYGTQTRAVTLAERQALTVQLGLVPVGQVAAGPLPMPAPGAQPPAVSANAPAPALAVHVDASDPARAGRVRSILGFGLGGVGLIVGGVAGAMSMSKVHAVKDSCDGNRCGAEHRSALASANTLANVANVTIPLGILGIAYGLYEWLTLPNATAPRADSAAVRVELTATGAAVKGTL